MFIHDFVLEKKQYQSQPGQINYWSENKNNVKTKVKETQMTHAERLANNALKSDYLNA